MAPLGRPCIYTRNPESSASRKESRAAPDWGREGKLRSRHALPKVKGRRLASPVARAGVSAVGETKRLVAYRAAITGLPEDASWPSLSYKSMEYFMEKLRMSRSTKDDETPPPSPYADQERRPSRLLGCQLHYPSPTFIDRVLLGRSLKVRRTEGEGVAEFSNSEFVQECLRTHNELRLRHEVPPLRLCSKLLFLLRSGFSFNFVRTDASVAGTVSIAMTDVPPPLPPRLGAGLQAERRSAASDHLHMTLPGSSSGSDVDDMESDGGYTVATKRRLKRKLPRTSSLCDLAQYWANHLAHTDDFYYRKFRDVGENLFCRWSYVPDFDVTGDQVARYWYSEIRYYDFLLDPSILHVQAGHFSQMVWRSSTTFGVGKARTRSGKIIVVAMYKPAGNVLGEFHHNVLPQPPADEDEGSLSPQLSDVAAAASAVAAAASSPSSSSSQSPR
ncbi:hypothetical protein HPB49_004506 [Dermacentor silvarum]|uniref:Uncharacterized protein n=1 Tax=Dermacentor silvarum TaxID=543639 RepID=A0ACB8DUV4_DERSI|nr:hypothetical protein HPB49_004506 [Dermacentor silvarum]